MDQKSSKLLATAPMMAWSDRHCRFLHRQYASQALLFTEMITTGALLFGKQYHLLDFNACEHPVAVQFGGNDPGAMAECAAMAQEYGYDEVNINVGCPSDRVQKGTFGACLMQQPDLVADCVAAMRQACTLPVTVKCRTGIVLKEDPQAFNDENFLHDFVGRIVNAGCERLYLHARVAVLGALTPAQNRDIPPLTPEKGERLKLRYPQLQVIINGGITDTATASAYLDWADGVMIGRAAYHQPRFLSELERLMFGRSDTPDEDAIVGRYIDYMAEQMQAGVKLNALTKHLLHSFNGRRGARRFRQILSDANRLRANDLSLVEEALEPLGLAG
ncbi:MAG: tRNA dihydrouridine(20/20a) synthase DusA [Gammaproteobacteria bacterium]